MKTRQPAGVKMRIGATKMATYEPGDFVKAEFRDERTGEAEWMWVRVELADDNQRILFGWLDNQPVVFAGEMTLGQRLAVSYDNVREHAKAGDFSEK